MKEITIERTYFKNITLGQWKHDNEIICLTMELPNKGNLRNVSCIPEGKYQVIKQPPTDTRPYYFFRLPHVPNRSGILIHPITYVKDLRGCIGVGRELKDLNRDSIPDMTISKATLAKLVEILPDEFIITIRKK